MPLSGKALLKRLLAETCRELVLERESKLFDNAITERTRIHLNLSESSVLNSIEQLYALYKARLESESGFTFCAINSYIATLPSQKKNVAEYRVRQVRALSVPYRRLANERKLKLNAKQILLLAYLGATDPRALKNQAISESEIKERKFNFIETLINAGNDIKSKYSGDHVKFFHALIASLNGIHDAVTVVLDKQKALSMAVSSLKPRLGEYFERWILQESNIYESLRLTNQSIEAKRQDVIIKRIQDEFSRRFSEDVPDSKTNFSTKFIENAKRHILKTMKIEYEGVLNESEINEMLNNPEYISKTDLVAPQLRYDLISRERAIIDSQKQDTLAVDKALQKTPELGRPFSNVLMVVAQHYTPWLGYPNALRDLLQMVSPDAVAVAVTKKDSQGVNACTMAAEHQFTGGFTALVESLHATESGQQALYAEVLAVHEKSHNGFNLAAKYQTTGGFTVLVERLLATESGQKALYDAMLQVNLDELYNRLDGNNGFMMAAAFQDTGSFTVLVERLLATASGQQVLYDAMLKVNFNGDNGFMMVARYQTTGGFKALVERLSATESGRNALCAAMLVANKDGWTGFMTVARYQTTGGFKALAERLLATPAGQDAMCRAMLSVFKSEYYAQGFVYNNQSFETITWFYKQCQLFGIELDRGQLKKAFTENAQLSLAMYESLVGGASSELKQAPTEVRASSGNASMTVATPELVARLLLANKNSQNEFTKIAQHQTAAGFTTLVESLLATKSGQDALDVAMLVVDQDGWNGFMSAAQYQSTGGFTALVERLSTTELGQNALCAAMSVAHKDGLNGFMLVARYQTTAGFTTLIERLSATELGRNALCAAMSVANKDGWNGFNIAAQYQTTGGFTALVERLLETPFGQDAMQRAMMSVKTPGMNALDFVFNYQSLDTMSWFYNKCQQNDFEFDCYQLKKIMRTNPKLESSPQKFLLGETSSELKHAPTELRTATMTSSFPMAAPKRYYPLILPLLDSTELDQKALAEDKQPNNSSEMKYVPGLFHYPKLSPLEAKLNEAQRLSSNVAPLPIMALPQNR